MRPLPHHLFVLAVAMSASACVGGDSIGDHTVVEDDLGRRIRVRTPIERIVTLSPSATETVFAAGAGSLIVGISLADDFPPQVSELSRFNTYPIDLEAIVALAPDLVLASDQVNHPAQVEPLDRLHIPSYFLASRDLEQLPDLVRRIGRLLGTEGHADRAADSLLIQMRRLRRITADVEKKPDVLVLAGANPLYGFGSESYIHDLVALAGGRSVTASIRTATPILSDEYVLRTLPDVIIGTDSAVFSPEQILHLHPTWDIVPAVESGRVFAVDPDLIYRPGPRLIEGAYRIADLLHPQLAGATAR